MGEQTYPKSAIALAVAAVAMGIGVAFLSANFRCYSCELLEREPIVRATILVGFLMYVAALFLQSQKRNPWWKLWVAFPVFTFPLYFVFSLILDQYTTTGHGHFLTIPLISTACSFVIFYCLSRVAQWVLAPHKQVEYSQSHEGSVEDSDPQKHHEDGEGRDNAVGENRPDRRLIFFKSKSAVGALLLLAGVIVAIVVAPFSEIPDYKDPSYADKTKDFYQDYNDRMARLRQSISDMAEVEKDGIKLTAGGTDQDTGFAELGSVRIRLPAPAGFSSAKKAVVEGISLLDAAKATTPESSRLIDFFIENEDLRLIESAQIPGLYRSIRIVSNRKFENNSFSASQFSRLAEMARREAPSITAENLGLMARSEVQVEEFFRSLKGQGASVQFSPSQPMGIVIDREDFIAYAQYTFAEIEAGSTVKKDKMLSIVGYARLADCLVYIYAYSATDSAKELNYLIDTVNRWEAELQRLNPER